jgi:hypothetical protein
MHTVNIKMIVLVTSMAWNLGAIAAPLSKADYQAGHDRITAAHNTATEGCNSMSGNARDICTAEADGQKRVGLAELEADYKPGEKSSAQLRVAKADTAYAVAIQRCDDLAGNAKDVCVKEAKSAKVSAKADSRAEAKTRDADKTADETSAAAHKKARKESTEARRDAAEDKRDADYAVAKEKCDAYSGVAKDSCIDKAKLHSSKP